MRLPKRLKTFDRFTSFISLNPLGIFLHINLFRTFFPLVVPTLKHFTPSRIDLITVPDSHRQQYGTIGVNHGANRFCLSFGSEACSFDDIGLHWHVPGGIGKSKLTD
jgi:hypothetical protein